MYKKSLSVSAIVLAVTLTNSAFAAVGGSNPTPQVRATAPVSQAVGGSNPTPQAVGGSNPTPQEVSWWSVLLTALGF